MQFLFWHGSHNLCQTIMSGIIAQLRLTYTLKVFYITCVLIFAKSMRIFLINLRAGGGGGVVIKLMSGRALKILPSLVQAFKPLSSLVHVQKLVKTIPNPYPSLWEYPPPPGFAREKREKKRLIN